eukprot:757665-Hanusia_phi.AAC.5
MHSDYQAVAPHGSRSCPSSSRSMALQSMHSSSSRVISLLLSSSLALLLVIAIVLIVDEPSTDLEQPTR